MSMEDETWDKDPKYWEKDCRREMDFQEYIPEIWQVKKDVIYSAVDSLQLGLEYAEECLITHDNNLGRTIARNKRMAEYIEEHIAQIKKSIEDLKSQ